MTADSSRRIYRGGQVRRRRGTMRATEGSYDAIILDIMLPGRSGFSVCAELRDAGVWTPILMFAALD
ncbi:response regulator transcription factor [Cryobacterium cryoconiti]|uniref:Response regulator transcription factor n=1 Tax=Cryobacterium cryoconiti TaxID=1259239 RepID=A0A4Y8JXP8_9MICO|nr:response regulator transcription factor [Cryobacterium cryoconiti]